jgi:primosomal protein N' (replication factor Y)
VPTHHAVRCAVRHDYHGFVHQEVGAREAPAYPPLVRLANVVLSGTDQAATAELAERATVWIQRLLARAPSAQPPTLTLIGPAPCPVERIKQRWRWHFLLKAERPGELTRVARYFLERFPVPKRAGLRVAFDRDPVALL